MHQDPATRLMLYRCQIGLKMVNATVRLAAGLRLGAPIVRPYNMCMRKYGRSQWTAWTILSPRLRAEFASQSRNEMLCRELNSAGAYATRETHSLCGRDDKKPDGAAQIPWSWGHCPLGTLPASTHTHSRMCKPTSGRPVRQQQERN